MSRVRAKRSSSRHARRTRLGWLRSARTWMLVAWLGTFAAVAYGLQQLEPYAWRIDTGDMVVEWVGPAPWLHEANWEHVLPELEARIDLDPRTDPYDERVCPWVASRLAGSAWVERVRRVTKQSDGRVKIDADLRKPFAMVECGRTAYLVDDAGVRLPEQWASRDVNRRGWLVIRGVGGPVPRPGEPWPGEDLAAGLKLARFLYRAEAVGRVPFRESIAAIDVGNFRGRQSPRAGWLQLVTINPRSYIHWGLPPGEEFDIESSAELKLAMLCKLYVADGRFPETGWIDVRADDGIGFGGPEQ